MMIHNNPDAKTSSFAKTVLETHYSNSWKRRSNQTEHTVRKVIWKLHINPSYLETIVDKTELLKPKRGQKNPKAPTYLWFTIPFSNSTLMLLLKCSFCNNLKETPGSGGPIWNENILGNLVTEYKVSAAENWNDAPEDRIISSPR